jgi:hypothetical protein
MKKIFLIFVLALFSVLAFNACRSNTNTGTDMEENRTEENESTMPADTSRMDMDTTRTNPM